MWEFVSRILKEPERLRRGVDEMLGLTVLAYADGNLEVKWAFG